MKFVAKCCNSVTSCCAIYICYKFRSWKWVFNDETYEREKNNNNNKGFSFFFSIQWLQRNRIDNGPIDTIDQPRKNIFYIYKKYNNNKRKRKPKKMNNMFIAFMSLNIKCSLWIECKRNNKKLNEIIEIKLREISWECNKLKSSRHMPNTWRYIHNTHIQYNLMWHVNS